MSTQAARDPHPLTVAQRGLEKLVQCFLLPFPPEPQRLGGFQVAYHRQEFLLLPQVNLIDAHLPQGRLPSCRRPSLQVSQIYGANRALGQPETSGHLPCRRTLTSFAHRVLEPFAKRRLTAQ